MSRDNEMGFNATPLKGDFQVLYRESHINKGQPCSPKIIKTNIMHGQNSGRTNYSESKVTSTEFTENHKIESLRSLHDNSDSYSLSNQKFQRPPISRLQKEFAKETSSERKELYKYYGIIEDNANFNKPTSNSHFEKTSKLNPEPIGINKLINQGASTLNEIEAKILQIQSSNQNSRENSPKFIKTSPFSPIYERDYRDERIANLEKKYKELSSSISNPIHTKFEPTSQMTISRQPINPSGHMGHTLSNSNSLNYSLSNSLYETKKQESSSQFHLNKINSKDNSISNSKEESLSYQIGTIKRVVEPIQFNRINQIKAQELEKRLCELLIELAGLNQISEVDEFYFKEELESLRDKIVDSTDEWQKNLLKTISKALTILKSKVKTSKSPLSNENIATNVFRPKSIYKDETSIPMTYLAAEEETLSLKPKYTIPEINDPYNPKVLYSIMSHQPIGKSVSKEKVVSVEKKKNKKIKNKKKKSVNSNSKSKSKCKCQCHSSTSPFDRSCHCSRNATPLKLKSQPKSIETIKKTNFKITPEKGKKGPNVLLKLKEKNIHTSAHKGCKCAACNSKAYSVSIYSQNNPNPCHRSRTPNPSYTKSEKYILMPRSLSKGKKNKITKTNEFTTGMLDSIVRNNRVKAREITKESAGESNERYLENLKTQFANEKSHYENWSEDHGILIPKKEGKSTNQLSPKTKVIIPKLNSNSKQEYARIPHPIKDIPKQSKEPSPKEDFSGIFLNPIKPSQPSAHSIKKIQNQEFFATFSPSNQNGNINSSSLSNTGKFSNVEGRSEVEELRNQEEFEYI